MKYEHTSLNKPSDYREESNWRVCKSCWEKLILDILDRKVWKWTQLFFVSQYFMFKYMFLHCCRARAATSDANALSFPATVKISALKGVNNIFHASGDLDYNRWAVFYVLKQVYIYFRDLRECRKAGLVWISRSLSWMKIFTWLSIDFGVDRLWLNFNFWVDFFFNAEIVLQLGNQLLSTIDPLTTKNVPSTHTLSIHLLMSIDAWSLNSYYIFRPHLLYDLTTLIL